MASTPMPLDDGSTIPFVPMSIEMRDYLAPDWTYVACGALNLAWAGVVPADHELIEQTLAFLQAGRPLGEWDEEKQKFQGWDWGRHHPSVPADDEFLEVAAPKSGRCYLWRHKMSFEPGWIPQAFTFMMRDDMPALLEHLYSLISGSQHVELRSPSESRDGPAWCRPGQANLLWLMRSMLVREEGDALILAGSCPRAWLEEAKTIEIEKLPTHFGAVSYRLESGKQANSVVGAFRFNFHTKPANIRLRLRHPEGALPRHVAVNGKQVQPSGEWVGLSPTARKLEVAY
jgi:hypothetical protein